MKKLLSLVLALLIGAVSAGSSLADSFTNEDQYHTDSFAVDYTDENRIVYEFISSKTLSLSSDASGQILVELGVETEETMQKLGFTSLKVQKWSGSSWQTASEITNQFSTSTDHFTYSQTFSGLSSGYTYRVKVTLRAKRAQGEVQDMTITSDSIICH